MGFKYVLFYFFIFLLVSCEDKKSILEPEEGIAVYGGSIAAYPEADISKKYWESVLSVQVKTYAVPGAGFSDFRKNTIEEQLRISPVFEYYLLWCSTNDFGQPIEDGERYSPHSQNGGMRRVIRYIKSINPEASIIVFTSLPSSDGRDLYEYVKGQISICQESGIEYLDQFHFFDGVSTGQFYQKDKMHLTKEGYEYIKNKQIEFLKKIINTQ